MISAATLQHAFSRLPSGAREAEANEETHDVSLVELHDGAVTGVAQSAQSVWYVRVSGERTGYTYTQDLSGDPGTLLGEAYANGAGSERSAPDAIHRGSGATRLDFGRSVAVADLEALARYAADFERALRASDPRITDAFVSLKAETTGLHTVNSHGLDAGFSRPLYILSAIMNSESDGRQHTVSYNRSASALDRFSAAGFGADGMELLESQYGQRPFVSGRYPAVLHRNVVYNILETAWQLFSGLRYLEGSSLFAGKLGSRVAAACLGIRDYPSRPDSGFDIPCDCEGTPGVAVDLVEGGVLAGLLHSLGTAAALGAKPTGNAGRRPLLYGNIQTDVMVTPRNVCIEPGQAPLGDLVGRMGDGVLVTTSFDVFHSINIASGAFSIPCKGVVVRGGRREAATGPMVVSGNLRDLLASIVEVGNDLYVGSMLALDNYGIGACSLRVEGLDFCGA
jgi:PmbA protein